jgi:glycosyltransferase involved in cell wall biosynthesis
VPPPSKRLIAVDLRALVGQPTGIGVHTRELLLRLAPRARFRYLGLAHKPVAGAEELRAAGVDLAVHPAPLGVLWQQLRLPPILRARGADLLWSPLQTLPWFCPVAAVVTVHDLTVYLHPEVHRAKVLWSQRAFLRRSLEEARRIVAVSQATARDLERRFPRLGDKQIVIPNGVDASFRPDALAAASIRQELALPGGYLLYAGTLEPRKNLGTLLRAWEAWRQADPTAPPLLLVGPYGWKSEELVGEIERLGASGLRYLGRVERQRLLQVMQGAAVFAYPSLYEGFGLPPLEALACGVPTVVSDVSSLPEVVGEAGWRVPPLEVAAWSAALRQAWDSRDDTERRQRAVAWAARFSWQRAAEQLEGVFDEVLTEQP